MRTAPFGSRFDDPHGEYRVLYASSQREGAFAETLARFRVDVHVAGEQQAIEGDPEDAGYPEPLAGGVVPIEWIETRRLGTTRHAGGFVDLGHSDSLAHLRAVAGVRYLSRLGDELTDWAMFEPNEPSEATSEPIDPDDEALRLVFERFELRWG
jgi:hypothetical protein